jgi:hypothetical protein
MSIIDYISITALMHPSHYSNDVSIAHSIDSLSVYILLILDLNVDYLMLYPPNIVAPTPSLIFNHLYNYVNYPSHFHIIISPILIYL